MPNAAVTNTAVTEVVPAGTTFTPASGVEMLVHIQAADSGAVNIGQGGNSSRAASGRTTNVASEVTVLLDDTMTVDPFNQSATVTGFVVDS